ncbi:hypothetical protein CF327_g623 [Tilletia walkeri]|uniref:DUF202 domain-containing protein n=1 Tax=Tilletia walkeri TaxID=117179 RepID=A0A8X7T3S1_9BASI|nr:hypothetical protein CF327_g623 [Tilletia walkeri]KAE8267807.1 hypothetical protein A4X09_0g4534 [Tilletia walkeri]
MASRTPQTALIQRINHNSSPSPPPPLPHSHPDYGATSTTPQIIYSKNNVLDLRAAQRTFDGAYARTALGQLSYSVVILRLFQSEFYLVGIAYVALAIGLLILSIWRYKLTMESPVETIDDHHHPPLSHPVVDDDEHPSPPSPTRSRHHRHERQAPFKLNDIFRTAGDVVAAATAFTLALQIALLVLVVRL